MVAGHDIAMALRAAYLAMQHESDACFARHSVTADQFVLLTALASGDALTQRELAVRTTSDPNTVRAMLIRLEGQRLVVRGRHATDGRARTVNLTAKGRRLYQRLWAAGEPVRERLLAALGPGEPNALINLLDCVTRACATSLRSFSAMRTSNHRPMKADQGEQK